MPSPKQAAIFYLGENEQIVSDPGIIERIEKWGNGRLINVGNAKHEISMLHEDIQKKIVSQISKFFQTTTADITESKKI